MKFNIGELIIIMPSNSHLHLSHYPKKFFEKYLILIEIYPISHPDIIY